MIEDFISNDALGRRPRRETPAVRRLWDGISVFDREDAARSQATSYPWLGRFIAVLEIPAGSAVRIERTTRTPGHYTLWGAPGILLARVVAIVPV